MEQLFDLETFLEILKRSWHIVIITFFLGGTLAIGVNEIVTPKYKASSKILVMRQQNKNGNYFNDLQADIQIITSYKDLATDKSVIVPVSNYLLRKYGYKLTASALQADITIGSTQGSSVMTLNAITNSARLSKRVVNATTIIFKDRIKKLTKKEDLQIVSRGGIDNNPVSPNKNINLIIGMFFGIFLGVIIVMFRYFLSNKIQDSIFLLKSGINVLGHISHISDVN